MKLKKFPFTGVGQTHPKPSLSGITINGLPYELVDAWSEFPTKRSFAIQIGQICLQARGKSTFSRRVQF